jgi:hypothetical protein
VDRDGQELTRKCPPGRTPSSALLDAKAVLRAICLGAPVAWPLLLDDMAVAIDLDAQIDSLRGFLIDLDEHFWTIVESGDDGTRYAFSLAIGQLSQRLTVLEEIVRHHGDDQFTFTQATAEEERSLACALELLDGEFVVDSRASPALLWTRVRELLAAVDALMLACARGAGAPRLGVVLPLARSGR